MMDDYTFGEDFDKLIPRKKGPGGSFYLDVYDDEEDLEEIITKDQNKINKYNQQLPVKIRKITPKKK